MPSQAAPSCTIMCVTIAACSFWIVKSSSFALKCTWPTMEIIEKSASSRHGISTRTAASKTTSYPTLCVKQPFLVSLSQLNIYCWNVKSIMMTAQTVVPFGVAVIATQETMLAAEMCEELWTANSPHIQMYLSGNSSDNWSTRSPHVHVYMYIVK